jgi:VWFA-related protein
MCRKPERVYVNCGKIRSELAVLPTALIQIAFLLLSLALAGCPHTLVQNLEENFPEDSNSTAGKRYKPVYLSNKTSAEKLINRLDSTIENDSSSKTSQLDLGSILKFNITEIDDSDYPSKIQVKAIIRDSSGKFISGLAPPVYKGDDYHKYWPLVIDSCRDSANQADTFSVREITENESAPHSIAFVLDHSPSMGHKKAMKLQEAVDKVLKSIKSNDYITVMKFTSEVTLEMPLTNEKSEFKKGVKIDGLDGNYGVGTAIYSSLDSASGELDKSPQDYKKIIILFSDGGDNRSKHTMEEVLNELKSKDISVYTISYGMSETAPLKKIAEETKGRFYQIYSTKEFPYVFRDIYMSLKNYYLLEYTPPECPSLHNVSVSLSIPELSDKQLISHGIYDQSMFTKFDTIGAVIFLNIEFEFGKSELLPSSNILIEQVYESMLNNPDIKIRICGHTDDRGEGDFNQKLSEARAESVARALIAKGISPNRLKTIGYGERMPLLPNTNDENRARNRRTEFIILSN